jgi:hypoxanthine phosphoribosyltransferase
MSVVPPNCVVIPDAATRWQLDTFVVPTHYKPHVDSIMLPHGLIKDRVDKLAADIFAAYDFGSPNTPPLHMLVILKGAHEFFSDLHDALRRLLAAQETRQAPIGFDFVRISSYTGSESSGDATVQAVGAKLDVLKGKNVLVIEDIIDTGHSMTKLIPTLQAHGALSVKTCTLLQKRTPKSNGLIGDFVGFSIPDHFVVGYGLDYNEAFRELIHICVMNEAGIKFYA